MRFSYDPETDSAYVRLKEIAPGEASQQFTCSGGRLHGHIVVDLDSEDHVIGFEFPLNACGMLPPELFD